jgi:circadian clock protein KaiB
LNAPDRHAHAPPSASADGPWRLRLYISGESPAGRKALTNLQALCAEYLGAEAEIETVDISAEPARAAEDQVFAVPLVVRLSPAPQRRVIGDLSERDKVVAALGLSRRGWGVDRQGEEACG